MHCSVPCSNSLSCLQEQLLFWWAADSLFWVACLLKWASNVQESFEHSCGEALSAQLISQELTLLLIDSTLYSSFQRLNLNSCCLKGKWLTKLKRILDSFMFDSNIL